jgi:site-specific DNA-cytosine methylase
LHAPQAIDVEGFAGGLTLGIVQAGFQLVGKRELPGGFGIRSCETNRHLLGYHWDSQVGPDTAWKPRDVSLVFGNPPCSGFSLMSARGFRGIDSRINSCMWALMGFASKCNPDVIIMESVQQAYTQGRPLMQKLRDFVESSTGRTYHISHVLHNSLCVGGSSVRRRYFLVLHRDDRFGVEPMELCAFPTVRDVIGDLEEQPLRIDPHPYVAEPSWWAAKLRSPFGDVDGHIARYTPNVQRGLALLDGVDWLPGENMTTVTKRYHTKYGTFPKGWEHLEEKVIDKEFHFGFHQLNRWSYDRHARVVTGGAMDLVLHPTLPRPLTMREVMRIMGFPDDWRVEPIIHESGVTALWGKGVTVHAGRWIGTWANALLEGRPGFDRGTEVGLNERLIDHTHVHPHAYDRVLQPLAR